MSPPPEPFVAALADRYRIERELGAGGMATVYLAEDLKHHRQVAVKILRPELAAALGAERFLLEIQTTANLRHPHILPLYDSGEAAGFLYYVMPFVDGESLADRLARDKQLPIDEALRIAREVADALGYAHQQNVVHRDVKPANIMLERGHAVVADFGIARALGAAGPDRLTQTGMSIGTPTYMSPEQAAGEASIDGRTDLYSLGCVLYEMLAGQPPFTGPTAESVVRQHLMAEPPPVTQLRPAVPAGVAGVLQRALAKNPVDRFNPAAQFAEALTAPELMLPARRTRRTALIVGTGAVVLAAAVVVAALRGGAESLPAIGQTIQVTRDPGLELDPALSPDGSMVAYVRGTIHRTQLYVRQATGGGTAVALTSDSTQQHRWPRWSPDGSRIAFQSDAGVFVVPALGGAARLVARTDSAAASLSTRSVSAMSGLTWSPDGRRLAYAGGVPDYGLSLVPADGGAAVPIAAPPEVHSPAWSPDGVWIAVISGNPIFSFGSGYLGNEGPNALWLVPVDGGAPVRLTDGAHLEASPAWSSDGRSLFWISDRGGTRDIYRLPIGRSGAAEGEPERLTTGLGAHSISLSADGSRLAYASFRTVSNIWSIAVPRGGPVSIAEARAVTAGNQTIEDVSVTRDGQWLAFDADWNGNADIYRMRAAGGEPIPVTTDPAPEYAPAWSPDGTRLVFHAFRSGNRDIFTVNADGTGLVQRTATPMQELDADWGPDGGSLLFEVIDRSTVFTILPLAPGAAERTLAATGDFAVWSPAGGSIVYHALDGLRIVPDTGGDARMLVPNGTDTEAFYAAWSGDGRTVYYLEQGPAGWSIRSVAARGGPSRLLVRFDDPTRQHARYGFTTDDKRFWFTLGSHESDVWLLELTRR